MAEERTYGPSRLTLAQCREEGRPQSTQDLAAHIAELQGENKNLRMREQTRAADNVPPGEPASTPPAVETAPSG